MFFIDGMSSPVWVWFGAPIEPRRVDMPWRILPSHEDPPLDRDELPGLLVAWQKRADGWWGMVEYAYPHHGYGLGLRLTEWLPASRLRPHEDEAR